MEQSTHWLYLPVVVITGLKRFLFILFVRSPSSCFRGILILYKSKQKSLNQVIKGYIIPSRLLQAYQYAPFKIYLFTIFFHILRLLEIQLHKTQEFFLKIIIPKQIEMFNKCLPILLLSSKNITITANLECGGRVWWDRLSQCYCTTWWNLEESRWQAISHKFKGIGVEWSLWRKKKMIK